MKKFSKYLFILAAAVFTFTACEKDVERVPSPAFEGKAVFFPVSAESEELEPTAPMQHEIAISRDTLLKEALTVKLVVAKNSEDIFEVPETVEFAAGESEATFIVKFPKAQVDGTYTLSLELELTNSNPYLDLKPTYSYTVNIAKWEIVNDKKAIVFDGIVNVFYGTGNPGWYVPYARKNNADGSFDIRLLNPYTVLPEYKDGDYDSPIADDFGLYGGFPYNYPTDVDSEGTYNMTIHVDKKGNATFDQFDLGMAWSYGEFYGRHADSKGLGKWDASDKSITFPGGTVACAMADYKEGGFYLGDQDLIIYLDDALWKDINSAISIADLEDGYNDASIEWIARPAGMSTVDSEILQDIVDVVLENAVDPNPKDKQEGSDFQNLYHLKDLFGEGFNLSFYLDTVKFKVALPVALQPTSLSFGGKQIFVGPAETESFVEETVLGGKTVILTHFFLQVQTKDGGDLGVFEEKFYLCDEEVIFGEKAEDFAGTYKMTAPSQFSNGSPANMDVEIVYANGKLTLEGLKYCSPVAVEFDDATKTISIAPQELEPFAGAYDITLYTTDVAGNVSTTAKMQFAMAFGGVINMTADTEADGYLLNSNAAGGYVDGYYNLKFTPSAPAAAPARVAANRNLKAQSSLAAHKHATAEKNLNFKLQGKVKKHNFPFLQK